MDYRPMLKYLNQDDIHAMSLTCKKLNKVFFKYLKQFNDWINSRCKILVINRSYVYIEDDLVFINNDDKSYTFNETYKEFIWLNEPDLSNYEYIDNFNYCEDNDDNLLVVANHIIG